jgi:hypothetical protein
VSRLDPADAGETIRIAAPKAAMESTILFMVFSLHLKFLGAR